MPVGDEGQVRIANYENSRIFLTCFVDERGKDPCASSTVLAQHKGYERIGVARKAHVLLYTTFKS